MKISDKIGALDYKNTCTENVGKDMTTKSLRFWVVLSLPENYREAKMKEMAANML